MISAMDITDYAKVFKAFSEPVRLRILHLLMDKGELCVCDIVDCLSLSQSVISRHLAYLRNTGLLATRREGVWIYYRVTEASNFTAKLLELFHQHGLEASMIKDDQQNFGSLSNRSCC